MEIFAHQWGVGNTHDCDADGAFETASDPRKHLARVILSLETDSRFTGLDITRPSRPPAARRWGDLIIVNLYHRYIVRCNEG